MTTALQAKDRARLAPVRMVEIALADSGPTLYLADRAVLVQGQQYEDYLIDVGEIATACSILGGCATGSPVQVRMKNDPYAGYQSLAAIEAAHPFTGARCVLKQAYLSHAGEPSEPEVVFEGIAQGPVEIGPMGLTCVLWPMDRAADNEP